MRVLLAAIAAVTLLLFGTRAMASEARQAVDVANGALAADPPRREVAREALNRATKATDDPAAVGEAWLLLGQLDELDGAYDQALADDKACTLAAPNTRSSLRAYDRIDWLKARSEGGFEPLRRLEAVRRDPGSSSNAATIDQLAHDLESFPPGAVRVEARMLVAEAWMSHLHRPDDAIQQLRKVSLDPRADPLTARLAERELVDALVASGRIDDAVAEANAHRTRLDPRYLKGIARLPLRRTVSRVSVGVLVAFVALALLGLAGAARRGALGTAMSELKKLAPVAAVFIAFIAIAGGVLASQYEAGNATPFLLLGAVVLPLLLLARAWSAVGSQSARARGARALLCAATVVAAAFVLLEQLDPSYLQGFGL